MHTLVTDDDPAFRKALQGCGPGRTQPCCGGWCNWCGSCPCGAARGCWSAASGPTKARSGAVAARAGPGGTCHGPLERPRTLRARPLRPPGTNRPGAGLDAQAPGAAGPRPEDAAGGTGLPALAGRKPGLKPAGQPGPWRRSRSCPPEPFSTKVKLCRMGVVTPC